MGYNRGFSLDLPVPTLEAILGSLEKSDRISRRKIFLEILGVLMLDEELFQLSQEELDFIAGQLDVKIQEYEYFWCILTELKQTYKKMDSLLQS